MTCKVWPSLSLLRFFSMLFLISYYFFYSVFSIFNFSSGEYLRLLLRISKSLKMVELFSRKNNEKDYLCFATWRGNPQSIMQLETPETLKSLVKILLKHCPSPGSISVEHLPSLFQVSSSLLSPQVTLSPSSLLQGGHMQARRLEVTISVPACMCFLVSLWLQGGSIHRSKSPRSISALPRVCPQHSSRQHASTGAPQPLQPPLT